jgi:hypothetical protein
MRIPKGNETYDNDNDILGDCKRYKIEWKFEFRTDKRTPYVATLFIHVGNITKVILYFVRKLILLKLSLDMKASAHFPKFKLASFSLSYLL